MNDYKMAAEPRTFLCHLSIISAYWHVFAELRGLRLHHLFLTALGHRRLLHSQQRDPPARSASYEISLSRV